MAALTSCSSGAKITYLQNVDAKPSEEKTLKYEPVLQPDDLLSIIVSSQNPESTIPFNLPLIQGNYDIGKNQIGIKTYLIDNEGEIDFPVIGKVKLAGLVRSEANKKLKVLVSEYIKNPGINLRILNFKISVLGEVSRPGTFSIDTERITLLEALGKAGDLTIYGKRSDLLIIRENNGVKKYQRVDITKADFINSPFYYLSQNDVVVVNPNKTKINASVVGPNTTVILSSISILATIAVLLFR
ncbi:polysaccharide export protein [Flavobacterium franklandianum]|uniref:Polysaccharide export protein n=2 Tax=Flavobacterium franklandianum TaxID=2594430 RepID=A0A553C5V2_9FLAO|nr:polysaccharide export protein [Flavobacterium franklandianum]